MSDDQKKFERFRQEHARLHDPALLRGAVEFVPVNLSEVAAPIPTAAAHTGKKRKKRHGVRAAAATAAQEGAARTAAETPEGERLLPTAFMRKLLAPRLRAAQKSSATVDAKIVDAETVDAETVNAETVGAETVDTGVEMPRGEPLIDVEPQSVARRLHLFQEQHFALDAPAAQQVELVWREERAERMDEAPTGAARHATRPRDLQRAVLDHKQMDRFEAEVGIPDGAYLFAFGVDGYMRPEPGFARRLLLTREGLFAPRAFARHEHRLALANRNRTGERLLIESSAPWLVPEQTQIDLPAQSAIETMVRFRLPAMTEGINEGRLHISAEREEGAVSIIVGIVYFAVEVEVGGVVPEIVFAPREFGQIRQGLDNPQLNIEIKAHGRGSLSGMISLPHSGELTDFRLSAGSDDGGANQSRFAHTFQVKSAELPPPQPHRTEAALKVVIITDSFLANYKLCRAEIPYSLVHLKKSLPALSFGTVRAGATKAMRLEVERSDKQEIELAVELPSGVASYLEAYPARSDAYVFRFDTSALAPGAVISETIGLIDRRSGLRDQIKVLATVARPADDTAVRAGAH